MDEIQSYQDYLIRLQHPNTGKTPAWPISIENTHTGEWKGFASLKELLAFLEEQKDEYAPTKNTKTG